MMAVSGSSGRSTGNEDGSWKRDVAIVAGPLLLGVAALLVFLVGPRISGSDAPAEIDTFYSDGGSNLMLVAEPLALVGMFAFLWLVGRVSVSVATRDENGSRAAVAFAGGIAFAILAGASLVVHTTVAGTAAFSNSFEAEPNTAMLFSHLGYVLMAAAMIGAATMAFATVGALQTTGNRGLVKATYVVGVLGLIANLFVYLPLVLFLIWAGVVAHKLAEPSPLHLDP